MSHFRKIHLLWLCCLLFTAAGNAQNSAGGLLDEARILEKFGRVSGEILNQPASHSYPYEYLLNEASVRFEERGRGIVAVIDHIIRIKIYTDDPLEKAEAARVGIPYYFADNIENVINLEGITYAPDGSQTALDAEEVRTMDLNSRYKILEFDMPETEAGAVLEYKYTLERRYIEELPDFYFAHQVPTKEARFYLNNEIFLRYDIITQNVDFEISYNEERVDTSNVPLVFTYQRPEPVYVQKWSAADVPAVEASTYISSIDDIRGKLKFQVSEFGLPRQPLENSWDYVAAQILRTANPYQVLQELTGLKQTGRNIAQQKTNLIAAQDSIYRFVNANMQFNEASAVFAEDGFEHVLEGEPANQAEINMVLLALLRGAGIDAKPLYISGRDYGSINRSFPSLYQFNKMLVYSEIGEREYFMDASFAHSLPGLIPVESYNQQGMILSEEDYSWVEITPDRSVFHLDIVLQANLTEAGNLTGKIEAETQGYPSQQVRENLSRGDSANEIIKKTFYEVYPEAEINAGSVEIEEGGDGIKLSAQFNIPEYAVTFTEGMEFRPMVVGYLFSNPFESTQRRVPITLDAPEMLTIQYIIELPDGFLIEEAGESRSTRLPGAELTETYSAGQNKMNYSFDIRISRKEFPASVYSDLRRIYERWVSLSNDSWYIRNSK
ncbi:MAG: transglutaminase domain-containing protein [Balneolaceae bacterium]